jgi:hypothetical protein
MRHDSYGNAVSTDSDLCIAKLDLMVEDWLGYGLGAGAIFEAAAADPECVMANTLSAALHLFIEAASGPREAAPFLAKARKHAATATPRERLWLEAVEAWAEGAADRAIARHREIARIAPGDLGNVKLGQYHLFNLGDLAGMRALVEEVMPAHGESAYAHGMLAFGLEETNDLDGALKAAERAVKLVRREPWAHHAVAHIHETRGDIDEGRAFMLAHADTWADCNSFMLTHNWWHVALYELDRDAPEEALRLYDEKVWGVWKEYSQDQIGAASLLWRLEMRGIDVGDRWSDVADHVTRREIDHIQPFLDVQYLYALGRAGRDAEADAFLASLEAHAATAPACARRAWTEVAIPLAQGVLAHARRRPAEAAALIGAVVPRLQEIGGSHAQRDVFVQAWLDAALAAGRGPDVRAALSERAAARPDIAVHRRQLALA